MIKHTGFIAANYGGDVAVPLVAPEDIAAAIVDELQQPETPGVHIRYVASDERTGNEVAAVLGKAVGMPGLKWKVISDKEMQAAFEGNGIPTQLAADLTEMYAGLYNGNMAENYRQHKPVLGRVKLEDYAKDFAALYEQNTPASGR